jgi:Protein of unknown function (DUF664)
VPEPFPSPTIPASSRTEVFGRYLDYFRARISEKIEAMPPAELRRSRLPSGWTPLELVKHLRHIERRWLEWGFDGQDVGDPWADELDRSRAIIAAHDLDDVGKPGERWDGAAPATLERVLFHLLQEYARHLGQLDIVTELATGLSEE